MGQGYVLRTALAAGILATGALADASTPDPSFIFSRRCASCHTVGKGDRVGPDLRGATERHDRRWLHGFIRSSESVIRSGDPAAVALFRRFKQQRMPDHELSIEEIDAVLDFVAAGGPAASPGERTADSATPEEIAKGRELFGGLRRLANGGAACVSCHSVADQGLPRGGSLAPDLTGVYVKYRDQALGGFLRQLCFPRAPEAVSAPLTENEAFLVKAYLRQAAVDHAPAWSAAAKTLAAAPGGTLDAPVKKTGLEAPGVPARRAVPSAKP